MFLSLCCCCGAAQSSKFLNDKKKKLLAFKNTTNAKYVAAAVDIARIYSATTCVYSTVLLGRGSLLTLCCFVGRSDSMAKSYLEKFSWDLMRAVDEFYANGGESLTPV